MLFGHASAATIALLEEGLALRANAGGAIKTKIREAIVLLKREDGKKVDLNHKQR